MTMAKGIANGLPLAAVVTGGDIADSLVKNTISTFGGSPVSCAAANKTVEIIERDNLAGNCAEMGAILRRGLEVIREAHPRVIGDVRGFGLMQALELVVDETQGDRSPNPKVVDQLMEETKKRGLLIGRGGLAGNAVRISPALNINQSEVEEALEIITDSFTALKV
ncbi:MAG: aminotransferase class III-fold pyridoxal phosphate-dependent enzyme, partial [Candidatus Neomarinimicrobiota bacterium]